MNDKTRREFLKSCFRIGGYAGIACLGMGAVEDARGWGILPAMVSQGACISGNNSNCVLLIHSNTADGSTTFVDSSQGGSNHTADITVVSSAHHDTDQAYFGTTSIDLTNATQDLLTVADSADWDFGTGDFSVEMWTYWKTVASYGLIGRYTTAANTWGLRYVHPNDWYWYYGDGVTYTFTLSWTPTAETWYHFVIARGSGSLRFFVDGVQKGSTEADAVNYDTAQAIGIGNYYSGADATCFNGYIDEVAIFKGSANGRTADFTVPAYAYCN